jgi:hypothetical protein
LGVRGTAGINAILNVCPPELAERVLIDFFNRIYVPQTTSAP